MALVARKLDHQKVARPLKVLVPLIQDEITAGTSAGIEHYRRAGEMLVEAREQVAFHGWGRWLSKNFALSRSTAFYYMKLAQQPERSAVLNSRPLTLREATGQPKEASSEGRWRKIREAARRVVVEDFQQERQARDEEVRLLRELILQMMDLGYRALATRLHPDRGGSQEAMVRLNRARDKVKAFATKGNLL